jgi:hypothetical protein
MTGRCVRATRRLGLSLSLGLLLSACGASAPSLSTLDARAVKARSALSAMDAQPDANTMGDQLDQARAWLTRFEARRASDSPDADDLDLLLEVIEQQLVRANTWLARTQAERQLAERQARYETESRRLETVRRDSARLKNSEATR